MILTRFAFVLVLLLTLGLPARSETALYVAVNGSDGNSGSRTAPLATLEGARDAIQRLRKGGELPKGGVTVWIRGGDYTFTRPFALTAADSGTAAAPIAYRAFGDGPVRLIGGPVIARWTPVTDPSVLSRLDPSARDSVRQADIKSLGYRGEDDPIALGGRSASRANWTELFYDDQPMTLARWPKTGFDTIASVVTAGGASAKEGAASTIGKFTYTGDRPSRWTNETAVRLHGYWFWDWADDYQQVASIDAETRTFTLARPFHHYGYRKGQRYYAENLLCELSTPGEYYIDRKNGIVYFWPPMSDKRAVISVVPILIQLGDVAYVTIRGVTLEDCREAAIAISGGNHVSVAGCTIRNTGGWGVRINGGSQNRVVACDISDTGDGGVSMSGGDRKSLTPGGHVVDNCIIHRFARLFRTYQPAVDVSGVGNRVSHCLIFDAPHCAILLTGNNHVIEYNNISHVCYETGDVGAFYCGRDWTARGTVIRCNKFHDIAGPGRYGAMGVYLDDCVSGEIVTGNLFYNVSCGVEMGGGRDTIVDNNIFVNCTPAISADARGLGWAKDWAADNGTLMQRLKAMPYMTPPWSTSYPQLVNILDDAPGAPKGCRITNNICAGAQWLKVEPAAKPFLITEHNFTEGDPHFVDADQCNFTLRTDSPALAQGFKPLDVERAGIYADPLRPSR